MARPWETSATRASRRALFARLEEVGAIRRLDPAGGQVLEKGPSAGPILQGPAHAQMKPGLIREFRAEPMLDGAAECLPQGGKEALREAGRRWVSVGNRGP